MSQETKVQPDLNELMACYLQRQADARASGISTYDGEVTPYEVGPVQPLDPKLAWDEAHLALGFFGKLPAGRVQAPPQWAQLVSGHESIVAIAFSAGNFPQLMRSFQEIQAQPQLTDMRPNAGRPVATAELLLWVDQIAQKRQFPQMLLALGAVRLAKNFDAAARLLDAPETEIPSVWRSAWENEKAAVFWHSGRHDEARGIWDKLEATAPVLFNRGMAALFAGETAIARLHLPAAIAQIPASSAWHHLGRLYMTLVDLRR